MQSGWSVGILMIAMGALSVGGFGQQHPPTQVGWVIAGLLVCGGGILFLRRPFAWWLGMLAAAVTVASGLVAQFGKPEWALPVPPLLAVVIGLYLLFRLTIARAYFFRGRDQSVEP
jgi:hypothetical protein